jgi:hypothetical protein
MRYPMVLSRYLVMTLLLIGFVAPTGARLLAQDPVLGIRIINGEEEVGPDNLDFEVWMEVAWVKDRGPQPNLLESADPIAIGSDGTSMSYTYTQKIPGNSYPYDLYICHGFDTMTVHIRTWFVDWYQANFLIVYQPGEFCFDMLDARAARNGIVPVDIRPFLNRKEGDCKSR